MIVPPLQVRNTGQTLDLTIGDNALVEGIANTVDCDAIWTLGSYRGMGLVTWGRFRVSGG